MPISKSGPVLLYDVSTGIPRPIVPEQYRRDVFDIIHNLAHPGRKITQKLIPKNVVLRNLNMDGNLWEQHNKHRKYNTMYVHHWVTLFYQKNASVTSTSIWLDQFPNLVDLPTF